MINTYLYPEAYVGTTIDKLENNMRELNAMVANQCGHEHFLISANRFYQTAVMDGTVGQMLFGMLPDKQFSCLVLPKLMSRLEPIDTEIHDIIDFDAKYPNPGFNALYGIVFPSPRHLRHVTTHKEYNSFKKNYCHTPRTFWMRKSDRFPYLTFCDAVKPQIERYGGDDYAVINDQLDKLNSYIENGYWTHGALNLRDVTQKTGLTISGESDSVKNNPNLRRYREFTLPDSHSTTYFDFHLKPGNIRIYILPNYPNMYIGYIGPHLPLS